MNRRRVVILLIVVILVIAVWLWWIYTQKSAAPSQFPQSTSSSTSITTTTSYSNTALGYNLEYPYGFRIAQNLENMLTYGVMQPGWIVAFTAADQTDENNFIQAERSSYQNNGFSLSDPISQSFLDQTIIIEPSAVNSSFITKLANSGNSLAHFSNLQTIIAGDGTQGLEYVNTLSSSTQILTALFPLNRASFPNYSIDTSASGSIAIIIPANAPQATKSAFQETISSLKF